MDGKPRTVTMEQAQGEALVFGVDDDGKFYGETAEGEILEILAEPATIMCDQGPAEPEPRAEVLAVHGLQAEARALHAMLPGKSYSDTVRIVFNGDTLRDGVDVWISCYAISGNLQVFTAPTVAEAVAQARSFIETAPEVQADAMARRMAPAIMNAVADHGACTAAHLMEEGFTAAEIAQYGAVACERASIMAGGRAFSIAG